MNLGLEIKTGVYFSIGEDEIAKTIIECKA